MQRSSISLAAMAILVATPLVALAATYRADQQPGSAGDVSAGAKVYADSCAMCHGAAGEGMAHSAPRLNDQAFLAAVGNDFLRATITRGRPETAMISWETTQSHADAGVKKKQVEQLVAFMRSWQTADGLVLDESPLEGKVARGERIYGADCVECHRARGEDADTSNVTIDIGGAAYLSTASDGYLRAVFGTRCKDLREVERNGPIPEASDYPLHYTTTARDGVLGYLRENAR